MVVGVVVGVVVGIEVGVIVGVPVESSCRHSEGERRPGWQGCSSRLSFSRICDGAAVLKEQLGKSRVWKSHATSMQPSCKGVSPWAILVF